MKQTQQVTRFTPNFTEGLSLEQVNQRTSQHLINQVKDSNSKSYFNIFAGNIFTFFNLMGLLCCLALLSIEDVEPSRFFFVLIYLANISIGIIQEIRAKRCIHKLSIVAEKQIKVVREGKTIDILSKNIVLTMFMVEFTGC